MEGEKNQYQGVSGGQDEEVKSRGLFDFMKKNEENTEKEEKKEEELTQSMENVHVTQLEKMDMDKKDQEKKEGLFAKLHRSDSSSSSSVTYIQFFFFIHQINVKYIFNSALHILIYKQTLI